MTKKISIALLSFTLLIAGLYASRNSSANTNELVALLPDSDGVVTLQMTRLLNEALPQILSANEPMLGKVDREISKIKDKTGLDLKQFREVVIGVRTKAVNGTDLDLQPIVIARGNADLSTLEEAAKLASEGEVRTEEIAGRRVLVFSAQKIVDRNVPADKKGNSLFDKMLDKFLTGIDKEAALVAYDQNTVALGSLPRIKELLLGTTKVDGKMLEMLNTKPGAVANFAMVAREGLSRYLELEEDELGKGLDSVREVSGAFDVIPGKSQIFVNARTADVKQAENLEIMLQGFQGVFAGILKRQKGADKKVYGRMLENLTIDREKDQLKVNLEIPQKDIDVIVGKK